MFITPNCIFVTGVLKRANVQYKSLLQQKDDVLFAKGKQFLFSSKIVFAITQPLLTLGKVLGT